ncbi:hypothetical protein PHMEG_00013669 [Phytophthora megakarya]|uniref:Uncharacterized protein n=1 Tax=Phytophthora megakarya TaxID=4795 RepID=A0A225W5Q4_9STRA|nr:hypothetical protein PHMEG_00013669 [Phytophthora megakarya]
MWAHNAVWVYAASTGNKYARLFAENRRTLSASDRLRNDTKWLRDKGGLRLLPLTAIQSLMVATPDTNFPAGTTGIIAERTTRQYRLSESKVTAPATSGSVSAEMDTFTTNESLANASAANSTIMPARCGMVVDTNIQEKLLGRLNSSKAEYYSTMIKEHRSLAQIAYDSGSMAGVLDGFMANIENAILLANNRKSTDMCSDPFIAVVQQIEMVFASFRGMIMFDPAIKDSDEASTVDWAKGLIARSKEKYKEALKQLYQVWDSEEDPNASLLPESRLCFGKVEGFPCLPNSQNTTQND